MEEKGDGGTDVRKLTVLIALVLASGFPAVGAEIAGSGSGPPGFVREFSDSFQRAPTTSKPAGEGLGPLWDESPAGWGPYISALGDRAYCPQASTLVYVKSIVSTRGSYAEGLFRWVAPWPGGGIRFHLDATVRIQPNRRYYLMKYRHEPDEGISPRIVLYRAVVGGSKQFWAERLLTDHPPLDSSPLWIRAMVLDNERGNPVFTGSVAWGGPGCCEAGTLEQCEHIESFTAEDVGDPLNLGGTGGQVFLSVHHSDYELLHFNAGGAGATAVSLGESTRSGAGSVEVPLAISPVDGMTAGTLDIAYDPRFLQATGVESTPLLDGYLVTDDLSAAGWIRITLTASQAGTGSGTALILFFDARQPGCSLLDLVRAELNHGALPSITDEGNVAILGTLDGDGDGLSEASGDCSDQFDWIHPGAAERCNGADDDCDGQFDEGGVCACERFPAPREQSFWEAACRGSNPEVQLGPCHLDSASDTDTFSALETLDDIREAMLGTSELICPRAKRAFLAVLLNRGDDRLCDAQPIASSNTTATTLGAAIAELDGLLAGPGCDEQEAERALAIGQEINSGQAIPDFLSEELSLWLDRAEEGTATMHWDRSPADQAGRPTRFRILRSGAVPIDWVPLGASRCHLWFQERSASTTPGELRFYEIIGVRP